MSTRMLFGAALALALLGAGCGGGSTELVGTQPTALNAFEQDLVGSYALSDFAFIQPGEGGFDKKDFEAYAGELQLEASGFARICLELCDDPTADPRGCERTFTWTADAGWIYFVSADGQGADAWAAWQQGDMGQLTTEFRVPTNHAECEQLIVEDGFEVFTWRRVD